MPRTLRSPEKQKQHEKKRRIISALALLGFFGFFALAIWIPSREELLIKDTIVQGNKVLGSEEIKRHIEKELAGKYLGIFPKTNIFLYPKEALALGLIRDFPRIASAAVAVDSDRRLFVSVTERDPFALWCGEKKMEQGGSVCSYLDDQGFVFAQAPRFSGNAYFEFYGKGALPAGDPVGHEFLPAGSFQNIVRIKERMEGFRLKPVRVFVSEDGAVAFTEEGGYDIRFYVDQNILALESNMQAVFRSGSWGAAALPGSLEYLDFRFGNKVYYKYKNEETEITNQE